MTSELNFIASHGFKSNPFESTNSETEELLEEYFVPPPFFVTVLGDPSTPKSSAVFAPRGSGKTAQRRMIEINSAAVGTFLCITYDKFDISKGAKLSLEQHLHELCRLLTMGILSHLQEDSVRVSQLNDHEKQIVKACAITFAGSMTTTQYSDAVNAIKSLGDKLSDFWNKYGGPIAAAIGLLMKKAGLDGVNVSVQLQAQTREPASFRYFYEQLVSVIQKLDLKAVYILVDKVDENSLTTNDATAAFETIRALITDLPTLELKGIAYKFFLWDQLLDAFRAQGGRPDRINVVELKWTVDELTQMLSRRLKAFSDEKIHSFNQIVDPKIKLDVHKMLAYLSNGSPRDMIRMGYEILSQHMRTDAGEALISEKVLLNGIWNYCRDRSNELYSSFIADFTKVGTSDFTMNDLANNIFKKTVPAVQARVLKWQNAGAVRKIGELANRKSRPTYLYGFTDLKTVISINPQGSVKAVLEKNSVECPTCKSIIISSQHSMTCEVCATTFIRSDALNLLQVCALDV